MYSNEYILKVFKKVESYKYISTKKILIINKYFYIKTTKVAEFF